MSDDLAARQAINAAITDGGDLLKDLQAAQRTLRQEGLLDRLDGMLANLQHHIDQRAQELARPLIAQAHAEAFDEVKAAQGKQQRAEDLATELRRQIRVLERRCEQAEAANARVRRLCDLTIAASCRVQAIEQARDTLAALDGQEDAHDCDPPDDPAHDSPREWLCPVCKAAWDRVEHSEDEGEIYETWYEKRSDSGADHA